jgi:hypothetical protein
MARLGRDWLEIKPQQDNAFLSGDFDAVAVSGLLLALVREQRWDEIEATLARYASVFPTEGEYSYQRALITALAHNQKKPSSGK